jgi:hypothetical protein
MKLSNELDEIINQQGNMRIFFNGSSTQHQDSVLQVRFAAAALSFDVEHVILLRNGFPPKKKLDEIYCLFPNTRDERRRIVAAHRYWRLDSLNIDLNRALADSPDQTSHGGTTRFALAYGNNMVAFGSVQGTLYLVWAQTVTFYNAAKVVTRVLSDVPLLVNMNGEALITGLYLLESPTPQARVLPIVQKDDVRTPIFMGDHAALWVYEKRPERVNSSAYLRVMGYDDAVNYAARPSRDTRQWMTFDCAQPGWSELEDYDAGEDQAPALAQPYDWRSTPEGLFAVPSRQLTMAAASSADDTAYYLGTDGEEIAPDPFQELE